MHVGLGVQGPKDTSWQNVAKNVPLRFGVQMRKDNKKRIIKNVHYYDKFFIFWKGVEGGEDTYWLSPKP
jgi:hypothetical protein